jgi:hypothetical protein
VIQNYRKNSDEKFMIYFINILPPSQNIVTSSIQILSHNITTFKFPNGFFWYERSKMSLLACKLIIACRSACKPNRKDIIILLISAW